MVGLLCKNAPNPPGDPSITRLFDIHGQNGAAQKVSYPWSWAEIQTKDQKMCIKNKAYDFPNKPGRDGYVALGAQTYGEYLPPSTETELKSLATAFTNGAKACGGLLWDTPGQGSKIYPCVGALDDYFLWLDRNHCRAFTVECGGLHPSDQPVGQPPHSECDDEIDQVSAGLFAAIRTIKNLVQAAIKSGKNPQDLSRLSPNQLSCP